MANVNPIRSLSALASRLYTPPKNTISGVDTRNWPDPNNPVQPIAPQGSAPLSWPFYEGANLTYTPRSDAVYTANELSMLSTYPLARICIDNAKDILCQMDWEIRLRQMPGETKAEIASRRKRGRGDDGITMLSRFFERPARDYDWGEWSRVILENMLTIDAASCLVMRDKQNKIVELQPILNGAGITRYIDSNGFTPMPPNPAYAQLWQGMPRVNLTTDQLVYKPRNIVPRPPRVSSYLYGMSPTEGIAEEIKTGIARLSYVQAYYGNGSLSNLIHVVQPGVNPDKLREAMDWVNSELAGNLGKRRQYRIIQGFNDEGKGDQFLEPKEPVLADVFDDFLIRKICFAYGNSPQRLQKMMNRGSATTSQSAAQEEGIKPWVVWRKSLIDYIIQVQFGMDEYEIDFEIYFESDISKVAKVDQMDVQVGIRSRNEVREARGLDPDTTNPLANQLTVTTPNGTVPLGQVVVSGKGGSGEGGGPSPSSSTTSSKPAGKVNGHADTYYPVMREE